MLQMSQRALEVKLTLHRQTEYCDLNSFNSALLGFLVVP